MKFKDIKKKIHACYKNNELLYFAGFAGVVLIAVVFMVYRLNFPYEVSTKQDIWGQFGDYFGGILNPILSFAAFLGLLGTMSIQRSEAKKADIRHSRAMAVQRTEAKKADDRHSQQLFEARVFQLITSSAQIVDGLSLAIENRVFQGRRLTDHTWADLHGRLSQLRDDCANPSLIDVAGDAFDKWKDRYWLELSSYFDIVIFALETIASSNESSETKSYYMTFLRSQMTPEERSILFYYGVFEYKFALYAAIKGRDYFNEKTHDSLGDGFAQVKFAFESRENNPAYKNGPERNPNGLRTRKGEK